jgi:hypothetical protein
MFGLMYPPIFHEMRYKIVNIVQRHAKQTQEFPELISRRQEISPLSHSILQKQRIPICFVHNTEFIWVRVHNSFLSFPCGCVDPLIMDNTKAIELEIKVALKLCINCSSLFVNIGNTELMI